jgi:tight adherence protein B
MKEIVELFLTFIVCSIFSFVLLKGYSDKKRLTNRIEEFLPGYEIEDNDKTNEKKPSIIKRIYLSVATFFRNIQFSEKTKKLLLEAGSPLKPEEFLALRILVAAGIGILSALIGFKWYICTIAVIIGLEAPAFFIKRKRKKRLTFLSYQLIDVLGMMANSMRAGFSFIQAMQLVGKEVSDPLGPEFDRVVRQTGLGVPLEDVFAELVERLPNKELEVVVQAILAQRKSGGNLAELLETMEETIRGRVRILEELKTLTAQGKLSSYIITFLPIGLGLYLTLVSKDYFQPMLQHPLGWLMLGVCAVSISIGWVLIQKIIKIEV